MFIRENDLKFIMLLLFSLLFPGDFVKGARDGSGMFFYASGAIYDGCWKDNLKHGPGKFVFKNGRIYEGIFEYDHMVDHPDLVLDRLSTPGGSTTELIVI